MASVKLERMQGGTMKVRHTPASKGARGKRPGPAAAAMSASTGLPPSPYRGKPRAPRVGKLY